MCTLSWWITETERGIVFNRDELRARSRGEAPRLDEQDSEQAVLMPIDPDAGGTWMGVNASGVIVALLNNYSRQTAQKKGQRSRGKLVVDLLRSANSAGHCMELLQQLDASIYQGFLLFALGRYDGPLAIEWDGTVFKNLSLEGEGCVQVLTSSSSRSKECEAFRRDLFVGISRKRVTLKKRHISFHPEDPALGPLMVREDAATDSITEVVVGPNNAHMWFQSVTGNPPTLSQPIKSQVALSQTVTL